VIRRGTFIRLGALLLAAGLLLTGRGSSARPMDPVLSRLVADPSCQVDPAIACAPDRAQYTKLVSQLGFALAPNPVYEARSNGLAGFDISLVAALTDIDAAAEYWQRGTRGGSGTPWIGPGNPSPSSYLQLYTLEVRKGFGFGIEAGGSLGVMPSTSIITFGADVRVALLEGMRHGVWRYLPDTSLGASLRQATGLGELGLGTLALDARLSHPFVSQSGFIITPWLGYQWLRIAADSEQVDLTPGVNALQSCDYVGTNTPGSAGSAEAEGALPASGAPAGVLDGSPLCRASGLDLASSAAFGEAVVHRQRVVVGASFRREVFQVAAQLVTDLVRPDAAQPDDAVARALRCDASGQSCGPSPRQWTVLLELGASF
jgi:hypothetical protein